MADKAWNRLPGETDKAYQAFKAFLELEDRTMANVARKTGKKTIAAIKIWKKKYNWIERSEAYDSYQFNLEMEGLARERLKVVQRHLQITKFAEGRILKVLQKKDISDEEYDTLMNYLLQLMKYERLCVGAPTESTNVEMHHDGAVSATAVQVYLPDNGRDGDKK